MPDPPADHDDELTLRPGTTKSDVIEYLYRHPEQSYSLHDITDTLDIPRSTATTTLNRLANDGYIEKTDDGSYRARRDREDIRRYVASLAQVYRMFGHHRDEGATPNDSETALGDGRTDEDLDAELTALEDDSDSVDD